MTFDLDEAVEALLPWELSVKVRGVEHATRRPTVAEYGHLLRMGEMGDEEASKLLGSLFEPPVESIGKFGIGRVQGFLAAYLTYFNSRALKNTGAIVEQVRAAIANQARTGSASSSSSGRSSNSGPET